MQWAAQSLQSEENLEQWLRASWRVVPDPDDLEYVQGPEFQLCQYEQRGGTLTGDCDDAATLAASILNTLRIPSWLVAVRIGTDWDFSHVYTRSERMIYDPIVAAQQLPLRGVAEEMTLAV